MNKKYLVVLLLTVALLLIGVKLNWMSAGFIVRNFEQQIIASDLLLDIIPFEDVSKLNEILVIVSYLLMLFFIVRYKKYEYLPFYIFIIAVFQFFRAGMMFLTPLASPFPEGNFGLLFNMLPEAGLFPSGHTSVPLFGLLFMWNNKVYRIIFFILLILVISTLLISHVHYSIDIIATVFIVYGIYVFSEKHLKKYLVVDYR